MPKYLLNGLIITWLTVVTVYLIVQNSNLDLLNQYLVFKSRNVTIQRIFNLTTTTQSTSTITTIVPIETGPEYVLIGDSHSTVLEPLVSSVLGSHVSFIGAMCPLMLTFRCSHTLKLGFSCTSLNQQAWNTIRKVYVRVVILSSYWTAYYHRTYMEDGRAIGESEDMGSHCAERDEDEVNGTAVLEEYVRVIDELLRIGKKVVLFYQTPEISGHGWHIRAAINRNRLNGITEDISVSYQAIKERNKAVNDVFDKLEHKNLRKIYPEKRMCDETTNKCYAQKGELVYYEDPHHIVHETARILFSDDLSNAVKD